GQYPEHYGHRHGRDRVDRRLRQPDDHGQQRARYADGWYRQRHTGVGRRQEYARGWRRQRYVRGQQHGRHGRRTGRQHEYDPHLAQFHGIGQRADSHWHGRREHRAERQHRRPDDYRELRLRHADGGHRQRYADCRSEPRHAERRHGQRHLRHQQHVRCDQRAGRRDEHRSHVGELQVGREYPERDGHRHGNPLTHRQRLDFADADGQFRCHRSDCRRGRRYADRRHGGRCLRREQLGRCGDRAGGGHLQPGERERELRRIGEREDPGWHGIGGHHTDGQQPGHHADLERSWRHTGRRYGQR
ncbi:hypothetical protein Bpla01_66330, partial [Burkholderia plantarii]